MAKIFFSLLQDLQKDSRSTHALKKLKNYLGYLKNHPDKHTAKLYQHLNSLAIIDYPDNKTLTIIASAVERLSEHSLRDADFMLGQEKLHITHKDKVDVKAKLFPLTIILENIRSAFNVGSIFRTSECMGIQKIFLCGYTASPKHPSVKKTAMGTDSLVSWEQKEDTLSVLKNLQADGVNVIAMETVENSKSLFSLQLNFPLALVFGNERFGINPETLLACDEIIHIPVFGKKNSLNVANTASILLYETRRMWES